MKKIAVITGASSGIGREFACLMDDGGEMDELWLIARRRDRLAQLAEGCRTRCRILALDLTQAESFSLFREQLAQSGAQVEYLINCAGFGKFGSFASDREEDVDGMLRLNVSAVVMMCKSALPHMRRGGHIINMASVVGVHGNAGQSNYAASKAGLIALAKSIGQEVGSRGIRANAIAPGFIDTAMTQALPDNIRAEWIKKIPLRRGGTVEDIANVATFLASDMSSYVTGQVIQVDGGMNM